MSATATLQSPLSLSFKGTTYMKGVPVPVSFDTARELEGNPRFKITGLDTRAAVEDKAQNNRPMGDQLMDAIREAADGLGEDDDNYDRNGIASTHAIGAALGYAISVPERDKALGITRKGGAEQGQLDQAEAAVQRKPGVTIKPRAPTESKEAILAAAKARDALAPARPPVDPTTEGGVAT